VKIKNGSAQPDVWAAVQANLAKALGSRGMMRRRVGADLVLYPSSRVRLSARGTWFLKPAFVQACREAVEALARETGERGPGEFSCRRPTRTAGRCLQCGGHCSRAAQFRNQSASKHESAELRGVRREAGFRRRTGRRGRSYSAGWRLGVADLRGTSGPKMSARPERGPAPSCCSFPNGLALRGRQSRNTRLSIAVARITETALPARLFSTRSEARTNWYSTAAASGLNADRTASPSRCRRSREENRHHAMDAFLTGRWADRGPVRWRRKPAGEEEVWGGRSCSETRDYVQKNGFPGVVLGLFRRHRFGGRGSAWPSMRWGLSESVCVMMPLSLTRRAIKPRGWRRLAPRALGCRYDIVPDRRSGRRIGGTKTLAADLRGGSSRM
jgi:NAD+ synthase